MVSDSVFLKPKLFVAIVIMTEVLNILKKVKYTIFDLIVVRK